jgi:hypothetical protein
MTENYEAGAEDEDEDSVCEFCDGMEEALVERSREFKASGWDPDEEGSGYRYGFTEYCDSCGRAFDFDEADVVYAQAPGPDEPTGSRADHLRDLASRLDLQPDAMDALLEVWSRRPMA